MKNRSTLISTKIDNWKILRIINTSLLSVNVTSINLQKIKIALCNC